MASIDDRIRGALDDDDKAFLATLESEPGMFRQLGDTLHGPIGRWTLLVYVMTFFVAGVGVWAASELLRAPDVRAMLLWGGLAALCVFAVGQMKLWAFGRMNTLTVLRELKRIELRLAEIERR